MRQVAVTGMGIISPIGNTIEHYAQNLTQGTCGIGMITRFNTDTFKVKIAAEVKDFSLLPYGVTARDARHMDLYTQYALGAAHQAVADSGIIGQINPERLGVYVGSGIGGISTFATETIKLHERGPDRISPYFIPMMISNMASGTIAIAFDAQGVCLPVVTACATSTDAIGEAYRAIAHGYADAIIAGGTEAAIEPLAVAGFTAAQALTTSGDVAAASIPFDLRRSGFVMGEGAGIVILEELEHAIARNAQIYATICGYGNACDAYHVTAPHPQARSASRAIAYAAQGASLQQEDVLYFNAHGTGTPLNDKTETLAIKLALGDDMAKKTKISSTKSMMGHMLGAAGAAEAIASILALQTGVIPPTIGYAVPDPECDLDYVPNTARTENPTIALSSSLGFGGHNACIAFRKMV